MKKIKDKYILICCANTYDCIWLMFLSWFKNIKLLIMPFDCPAYALSILSRVFFLKHYIKRSVCEFNEVPKGYSKFYYELNRETLELTAQIYNKCLGSRSSIAQYYNRMLKTKKFDVYLKNRLSHRIHDMLQGLHLVRLSSLENKYIFMENTWIGKYVVEFIEKKYAMKYNIKWALSLSSLRHLLIYYKWLSFEFIRRGMVFHKKKKSFELAREAVWGFDRLTCRDDIFIDGNNFKVDDILLLEFNPSHAQRAGAFKSAKENGFSIASVQKLKININRNIFGIFFFYFLSPICAYIKLLLSGQENLMYFICLFHINSFPIEVLMNSYDIKFYLSNKDWGDVEETIVFNKYKTKTVIFHWSDMTSFNSYDWNFIAHNLYFTWGDAHYDPHAKGWFMDKRINIGCIYKKEYNAAVENYHGIKSKIRGLDSDKKVVVFFDTSFECVSRYTEDFFLQYLEIVEELCHKRQDINVLLKPKTDNYEKLLSVKNQDRYKRLWNSLVKNNNFIYLDPVNSHFEEILAISDISVSMGMNSPSTIGLICGKDSLYFDNTGNSEHPFAVKYMNKIVFEDKAPLIEQIDSILNEKFKCKDIICEEEIRMYDAFSDDKAIERIKNSLCELTSV